MARLRCLRIFVILLCLVQWNGGWSAASFGGRHDGGPKPLRSDLCPCGLLDLHYRDQERVRLGNALADIIVVLVGFVTRGGAKWSVENPLHSYLWNCPSIATSLSDDPDVFFVEFDQC
eukprot:541485-Amphidinium_carterae.1